MFVNLFNIRLKNIADWEYLLPLDRWYVNADMQVLFWEKLQPPRFGCLGNGNEWLWPNFFLFALGRSGHCSNKQQKLK